MSAERSVGKVTEQLRAAGYVELGRVVFCAESDRYGAARDAERLLARLAEVKAEKTMLQEECDEWKQEVQALKWAVRGGNG